MLEKAYVILKLDVKNSFNDKEYAILHSVDCRIASTQVNNGFGFID